MVPTQDVVLAVASRYATLDYLPAVVVAVVIAAFAASLVLVSFRRRDAD